MSDAHFLSTTENMDLTLFIDHSQSYKLGSREIDCEWKWVSISELFFILVALYSCHLFSRDKTVAPKRKEAWTDMALLCDLHVWALQNAKHDFSWQRIAISRWCCGLFVGWVLWLEALIVFKGSMYRVYNNECVTRFSLSPNVNNVSYLLASYPQWSISFAELSAHLMTSTSATWGLHLLNYNYQKEHLN